MNTQDENQDTVYNSAYNPFPEPQTIPTGWDTSVFSSAPQTDSASKKQRMRLKVKSCHCKERPSRRSNPFKVGDCFGE